MVFCGESDRCAFSGENYEPESGSYQTQIESDLSYEAILAREAADENYVDEKTGSDTIGRKRRWYEPVR